MKKLILALALATLPLQVWAQDLPSVLTLSAASTTCAGTACNTLGVGGYGSAAVQLIVTGTATAVVEGSINGQLFTALTMSQVGGSGNVTSATATGSWSVNVAGFTQVRVRLSLCTSCNVVTMLQATRSGGGAGGGGGGGGGDASAANQSTEITSLQLIDDVVYAEDTAAQAADKGVSVLAVRRDADTSLVGSDNDYAQLQVNAGGQLKIACITGCSGGAAYTQDAALTVATSTGAMAMGRASAAAPSDVSADDDAVLPWYLRSGAQAIQPTFAGVLATTGAGNVGTGVQRMVLATDQAALAGLGVYVEDAAETAGGNLMMSGSVRRDTAASSAGTTGDNATFNTDALGRLWISGAYLEDAASASGDVGLMILTRRTDAVAASAGTDGDYQTLNTDASGRLWVNCSTGCSGGTQYTEDAASAGGETLTLAGAIRQNTLSSSTSADGDYGTLKLSTLGELWVNVMGATQAAGTFLTVRLTDGTSYLTPSSDQTEDAAVAGGETGPMVLSRRIDTPASSAGTSGDFAMFNTNNVGALWVSQIDPCSSEAKITDPFSLTARGVVIAATSSKKNYICAITVVAGVAEIFNIDEGTGTTCQTGTAAVVGSTTAANGLSLAANGGFAAIGGNSTVIAGKTANVDTCIVPSGSNRLAGFLTYVQR